MSIVTAIFMAVLATSEFIEYVTIKPQERMIVDTSLKQKLRINFNITFPALTCAETSIDAMDVAGDQQLGLDHDIFKTRQEDTTQFMSTHSAKMQVAQEWH